MIDFLAAITVALAMFGIMSMVLIPANPAHSRLRRIDQRASFAKWFGKYFSARTKRTTTLPWWTTPFLGL
jgi:hypothetical protein